jgi:hypothetical protein
MQRNISSTSTTAWFLVLAEFNCYIFIMISFKIGSSVNRTHADLISDDIRHELRNDRLAMNSRLYDLSGLGQPVLYGLIESVVDTR